MESPLIGMSSDGFDFNPCSITEDGGYLMLVGSIKLDQQVVVKEITFWIPNGTQEVTLAGTPMQGWRLWDQNSHAWMANMPPMKAIEFSHLGEVQQFRVKLKDFLAQRVVPHLRAGKEVVVKMDGSTFDKLRTGPHLVTNYTDMAYAIDKYARAILFYEFCIQTYPALNLDKTQITFPVTEPANVPPVDEWEPIPNVKR